MPNYEITVCFFGGRKITETVEADHLDDARKAMKNKHRGKGYIGTISQGVK